MALDDGVIQAAPIKWLTAKLQTSCLLCQGTIAQGDRIFPCAKEQGGRGRSKCYAHWTCAVAAAQALGQQPEAPVCPHWEERGLCLFGSRCVYRHPPERQAPLPPASPALSDAALASVPKRNRGYGRRNLVRSTFRAGTFRRFLVDTYGREALQQGSGVLDVASGKGDLCFELLNLNGIPATAVEPRALDPRQKIAWLRRGYYHWNAAFQEYIDRPADCDVRLPHHLRIVVTPGLEAALLGGRPQSGRADLPGGSFSSSGSGSRAAGEREASGSSLAEGREPTAEGGAAPAGQAAAPAMPAEWEQLYEEARQQALDSKWTFKGLEHTPDEPGWGGPDEDRGGSGPDPGGGGPVPGGAPGQSQRDPPPAEPAPQTRLDSFLGAGGGGGGVVLDPGEVLDAGEAWRRLTACSVVVGMHADQATGLIVDLALRLGKPFAVVPCCTYSGEFPQRRTPGGGLVRTYEELIQWLVAKDPARISVAALPFEGHNRVVYCR